MNYAWVTLLSSEDYLPAVLVLEKSLKDQSNYPLVVAVTDSIFDKVVLYLKQENVLYKKIPTLHYTEFAQKELSGDSILNTASKIGVFTLEEFDKLIYVDADTVFLNNCDEIFNHPDGSMLYDGIEWGDELGGHSALFLITPKNHNFLYLKTIQSNISCCDGNLLAYYFFPLKSRQEYQISGKYFVNYSRVANDIEYFYIVHFPEKPWFFSSLEEFYKIYQHDANLSKEVVAQIYFIKYLYPIWKKYPELKY